MSQDHPPERQSHPNRRASCKCATSSAMDAAPCCQEERGRDGRIIGYPQEWSGEISHQEQARLARDSNTDTLRGLKLPGLRIAGSFLGLVRFSHTLFALPFALTAATLAWGRHGFSAVSLAGIVTCMVAARCAAMAFNRLVDRDIDALNPRTAGRHLPAGLLSARAVCLFFLVSCLLFVCSAAIFLLADNPVPLIFAVPLLVFLCGYSLAKRFTVLAHFWLGVALGLSPLGAWIAIRGWETLWELPVPGLLGLAVMFWVAGFDILYATQDADFDKKAGLHSVPAKLGIRGALWVARACHVMMMGCLVPLCWLAGDLLGMPFQMALAGVGFLLLVEHALVREDDLSRMNAAFFTVNAVLGIGLWLVVLEEVVRRTVV